MKLVRCTKKVPSSTYMFQVYDESKIIESRASAEPSPDALDLLVKESHYHPVLCHFRISKNTPASFVFERISYSLENLKQIILLAEEAQKHSEFE